jgi:hypothetical protein
MFIVGRPPLLATGSWGNNDCGLKSVFCPLLLCPHLVHAQRASFTVAGLNMWVSVALNK